MRILVRTPNKLKKFRLWCDTVNVWVTESMTREQMLDYLVNHHYEPHTRQEAKERVDRKGSDYDAELLEWLNTWFDSRYRSLCYFHRKTTSL